MKVELTGLVDELERIDAARRSYAEEHKSLEAERARIAGEQSEIMARMLSLADERTATVKSIEKLLREKPVW